MNVAPSEHRVSANGLTLRVLEWKSGAGASDAAPTLVLVHGWMDTAASFDLVAPLLANAGYRVLAPDMRGFGESDRAPAGSYYHFPDYVADLAALADRIAPPRFTLVGHSMGGTIATMYTSARGDRVDRVALLEGTGPPSNDFARGAARLSTWLDELAAARPDAKSDGRLAAMHHHVPTTYEMMLRRLIRSHAGVDVETLRSRAPHLVTRAPGAGPDEDSFVWQADPRHKMTSPMPFFVDLYRAHAARITCPTLTIGGGATGYHPGDEAERLAGFVHATPHTHVDLEGAGHMMHWTQPENLAAALLRFAPPSVSR